MSLPDLTRDQIAGLVCIALGLLVPAAVIAWASARETLREARERWTDDAPMPVIVGGPDAEDDR